VRRVALPFLAKNLRNMLRRFLVHYLIRDFSLATLEAIVGMASLTFGILFGALAWGRSYASGAPATAGEVMIAALPILTGMQLVLSALNFDMRNVPAVPRQRPR
jgi:dolichol-phosphate mannosyltransferase